MTVDITLTLLIILAAMVLFATEKLRVDVVALLVLVTAGVLGQIPREDLFSGFSNSAVITVWAVYMVSGGLFKTGVADTMGRAILKVAGKPLSSPWPYLVRPARPSPDLAGWRRRRKGGRRTG